MTGPQSGAESGSGQGVGRPQDFMKSPLGQPWGRPRDGQEGWGSIPARAQAPRAPQERLPGSRKVRNPECEEGTVSAGGVGCLHAPQGLPPKPTFTASIRVTLGCPCPTPAWSPHHWGPQKQMVAPGGTAQVPGARHPCVSSLRGSLGPGGGALGTQGWLSLSSKRTLSPTPETQEKGPLQLAAGSCPHLQARSQTPGGCRARGTGHTASGCWALGPPHPYLGLLQTLHWSLHPALGPRVCLIPAPTGMDPNLRLLRGRPTCTLSPGLSVELVGPAELSFHGVLKVQWGRRWGSVKPLEVPSPLQPWRGERASLPAPGKAGVGLSPDAGRRGRTSQHWPWRQTAKLRLTAPDRRQRQDPQGASPHP